MEAESEGSTPAATAYLVQPGGCEGKLRKTDGNNELPEQKEFKKCRQP